MEEKPVEPFPEEKDWKSVIVGVVCGILPKWVDAGVIGLLIFGGCCGNVFALEAIIKDEPAAGPLITFVQFVTVSLFTIPSFLSLSAGPRAFYLKSPIIPLRSWTIYTIFFVTVNLLNNWAFAYRISVPLHIILRSGGPVASMLIGYLYNGRRYSRMQIFAVLLLTFGVVGAALADAEAQGKAMNIETNLDEYDSKSTLLFVIGFTILALAMLLSAFQGVYADRLYAVHGNTHWREALLYSHMLSIPFFLPTYPQLSSQFRAFMESSSMLSSLSSIPGLADNGLFANATMPLTTVLSAAAPTVVPSTLVQTTASSGNLVDQARQSVGVFWLLFRGSGYALVRSMLANTPNKIFFLVINALTQYICIRGVYLLAAKSSSLTVTIVLNIRKLVSLLFSIYIFGNSLATGVLIGGGFVFLGGALYGVASTRAKNKSVSPEYLQKINAYQNKVKV
ncbi:UPD-GlcNAc transporter [Talaromyces proteolyticus]|uniref:UPD-GlcNAc transporter n=1 Tax=Talaromyces proteolyticus TaxID=1131652 RepID=A0AAD4KDU1_9EURO|nr:UPD-GlcNAc transporter [Talaromyces proteolyticus]KAH8689211.1 UPD-GlcNAc transporter [Talaromyces proteolyticus]